MQRRCRRRLLRQQRQRSRGVQRRGVPIGTHAGAGPLLAGGRQRPRRRHDVDGTGPRPGFRFSRRRAVAHRHAEPSRIPDNSPQGFYDRLLASKPSPDTGKPDPQAMAAFLAAHPETAKAMKIIGQNPPSPASPTAPSAASTRSTSSASPAPAPPSAGRSCRSRPRHPETRPDPTRSSTPLSARSVQAHCNGR